MSLQDSRWLPQACHSQANLAAMLWPYKVGAPAEGSGPQAPSPRQKLQEIEARCREVPWSSVPFPPCAAPSTPCAPERPPSRWCRPWERFMTDMCRWCGSPNAAHRKWWSRSSLIPPSSRHPKISVPTREPGKPMSPSSPPISRGSNTSSARRRPIPRWSSGAGRSSGS